MKSPASDFFEGLSCLLWARFRSSTTACILSKLDSSLGASADGRRIGVPIHKTRVWKSGLLLAIFEQGMDADSRQDESIPALFCWVPVARCAWTSSLPLTKDNKRLLVRLSCMHVVCAALGE